MGAFVDDIKRATIAINAKSQAVFLGSVVDAKNSIVFGSSLTGSPGQVVADVGGGTLRDSWTIEFESPTTALIASGGAAEGYNQQNEDGIARPGGGPYIQRSAIGGRHSVSKTVDNFPLIVADNVRKLGGP